ncbi:YicC-like family, N-terminal region [Candidatus Ornithobacterium hominis]|uniref:YicC-like family, N-terminal region n=1 Tax=Candidatus Ornithobacterium hominis TaxID=2497989 RepID=A0A383U520_9FLAO|nr:YicC/YloC family endoribonuclease [Candidatus Ornithobacterium hominis]MCT7904605.1 YicC family protein [Candidatus Ornithobacterium hominis]SZD73718.1 YicC-like family, N-terminal region [Candidatus Ornithobacterium hominis]SZD74053.1 YicC-like family, N-terminal region [Candidatus Ornithobacterium hominis]
MILSMTGYGQAEAILQNKKYSIDIKTLNSKNLDLNIRLSAELRSFEPEIRQAVADKLKRGKIDVFINNSIVNTLSATEINENLILAFVQKFKAMMPEIDENTAFQQAMRMPDVITSPNIEFSEVEIQKFFKALENALENVISFREKEGLELQKDFKIRIEKIQKLNQKTEEFEGERIQGIRERMTAAIEKVEGADHSRLEQELIYYLEKLDVTEEKVRLANHCNYFLETLNLPESNGKKLNFILQEIGREINTLGSKSNHAEMQKIVVEMKDELEKIKEQILNIL